MVSSRSAQEPSRLLTVWRNVGSIAVWRWGAVVAVTFGIQGCATHTLETPIVVTMPLKYSGVTDRRHEFARLFQEELKSDRSDSAAADWLILGPSYKLAASPKSERNLAPTTSVLIAPGILSDCVASQVLPFGDGVKRPATENYVASYNVYSDLGLHTIRAVQLLGRASSERNGGILTQAILEEARRTEVENIVLIGYSKGLPDALSAVDQLERGGIFPRKFKALVSVAGVVNGTVLADRYEKLYEVIAGKLNPLECSPSEGGEVASLTKRERLAWVDAREIPAQLRLYSLAAVATRESIAPGLATSFQNLSALGDRNDGALLVADAILPRSSLIALVNSDHWGFVLPLEQHSSFFIKSLAGDGKFPRFAFFRALVNMVLLDLASDPKALNR